MSLQERVDAREGESRLMAQEVGRSRAQAESERAAATKLRRELEQSEARVGARDDQLAIMAKRTATAREDLQVQLSLIEEEMGAAKLKVDSKDLELELVMEEASGRERQAHQFMQTVTARLKKSHDLMVAKDELIANLASKLQATANELATQETSSSSLKEEISHQQAAAKTAINKLQSLEERHTLVSSDLNAATNALDNYRDSLVLAEVQMQRDRDRMAELQDALRRLQSEMINPDRTASTGAPAQQQAQQQSLPALMSDVGPKTSSSRVHFLYFLSSFLLLKTALSAQGEMGNVGAQDVYDEILRNEVPLEEWPTYIFTRVYSSRGHDKEVAALKAVARRAR